MAFVFIDTSAVYALINRFDANHAAAKARLRILKKARTEPVLTNFIVAECHALLLSRMDGQLARRWLLNNQWRIERVLASDEERAREIIASYTDKDYSYTDATSFAVMERLSIRRAFTFDRHFEQHGFESI